MTQSPEISYSDVTCRPTSNSDAVFINGSCAERPDFECMKMRLGRPWLHITDHNKNGGTSLAGRNPSSLKNEELKFWLLCQGDSLKGLKTKAQLVKR